MGISFTGLASGLDSDALITQLVAAEKSAAFGLKAQSSALGSQRTIIDDLVSKLSALAAAARGMDLATEARARTATASDDRVAIAVSGSAAAGSHSVRVTQL